MNKNISKVTTPKKLLGLVCEYYGLPNAKHIAGSVRPDLWRYTVLTEARRVACWILQRHCPLAVEDLQVALQGLNWSGVFIRAEAFKATRKLNEGDFAFRLGVQGVEQLLMLELGGCQKYSNASAKRRRNGRLNWQHASYLQDGKQIRKEE